MIYVNIWKPTKDGGEKMVGHASILVRGIVSPYTYISWWPTKAAGLGQNHLPHWNRTLEQDIEDEGDRDPSETIQLDGLDEYAIVKWWRSFGLQAYGEERIQGPLPAYNLAWQNCSTVVARGLKIAGGNKYASMYSSHCLIWRPLTVLDYARSIQRGLRKRRK